MPTKRPTGRDRITPEMHRVSLRLETWEQHWGSEARGRAAWARIGHRLYDVRRFIPEPFWAYTEGVPESLRITVPRPDPREVLNWPPSNAWKRAAAAFDAQRDARREWLKTSGFLNPTQQVNR